MIDQYFVLSDVPEEVSVPPAVPILPFDEAGTLNSIAAFFESQNKIMLEQMIQLLEKGMTNLGVLDLPPTGPDPSPITIPASGMITGNAAMAGAMQQMEQTGMQQTEMGQGGMQQAAESFAQGSGDGSSGDY